MTAGFTDSRHSRSSSMSGCVIGITGCVKPLLEVGFENLSMRLKSCGKLVLQECKGQLKPWRVTAIMGPSGECIWSASHNAPR